MTKELFISTTNLTELVTELFTNAKYENPTELTLENIKVDKTIVSVQPFEINVRFGIHPYGVKIIVPFVQVGDNYRPFEASAYPSYEGNLGYRVTYHIGKVLSRPLPTNVLSSFISKFETYNFGKRHPEFLYFELEDFYYSRYFGVSHKALLKSIFSEPKKWLRAVEDTRATTSSDKNERVIENYKNAFFNELLPEYIDLLPEYISDNYQINDKINQWLKSHKNILPYFNNNYKPPKYLEYKP